MLPSASHIVNHAIPPTPSAAASAQPAADMLKQERDRFVAFAFASADILVELNPEGTVTYIDGAVLGMLGRMSADLIGHKFFDLVPPGDRHYQAQLMDSEHAGRFSDVKLHLTTNDGSLLPFAVSGYTLSWLSHKTYLTLSLLRDDMAQEELGKRDVYSGLLKKENFAQTANNALRQASAEGKALKVTLLDLPELKAFLDGLAPNQAAGLMGEISAYLKSKSVGGDMAGIIDNSAYSFVHDASVNTEQVVNELITLTKKVDPKGVGVTPQAHTLASDTNNLTAQDSAAALLYTINRFATERGQDFSIHSLSEGYQTMLDDTVKKIAEFKTTVAEDKFQVAFQPIVDLKNGIIHHFETLVRFEQNDSFSNPFQFITFGEQAGIIGEFDLAMCQRTLSILEDAAKEGNNPLVSVNLSGRSLSSNLFIDTLKNLLGMYEKVKKQVIFEITESSKIADLKLANRFVQELRAQGNLCCLDDFGVGESSFDYLRHLQVDFIKIDGSYVKESVATPRGRHLLKAMAGLCRDLDVVTIGEMVEDEKAAHILWESGIRFGQGYLFGKPTVDATTLIHCSKPTPFYQGVMRAKKVGKQKSQWWKRDE